MRDTHIDPHFNLNIVVGLSIGSKYTASEVWLSQILNES
jgi:hypothetical protein